ncbi:MAG: hypothetical protein HOV79_31810 [Hamadaea sp.]|nr:hypothetical protein [Hamadaea sp.]
MARTALTLLLAGVIAVLVGLVGTATIAQVAVTDSAAAAQEADQSELGTPAGYGTR